MNCFLLTSLGRVVLWVVIFAGAATVHAQFFELRSQLRSQLGTPRTTGTSSIDERWKSTAEFKQLQQELLTRNGVLQPQTVENLLQKITAEKASDLRSAAIAETLQALADAIEPLSAAERPAYLDEIAKQLVPASESAIATARQRLITQLDALHAVLRSGKDQGKAWKSFLLWSDVEQLLSPQVPSDKTLLELEARWSVAPMAWDAPLIHAVGQEIETLSALLRRNDSNVEQVAAELAAVRKARDTASPAAAPPSPQKVLERLASLDCGSRLTQNSRYSNKKTPLMFSLAVQAAYLGSPQKVNENFTINDSRATGSGQIRGQQSLSLRENPTQMQLRAEFVGTNSNTATSVTQGARINSSAISTVRGTKDLLWGSTGMTTRPAQATANTNLQFTGVGIGGGRRYQSEAWSRVNASRGSAERDTQLAVERGMRERLDNEGARRTAELNKKYSQEFLNPLFRQRQFLALVESSSTASVGRWQASLVRPHEFLTWPAPPVVEPTLLQTTVHQLFPARLIAMRLTSTELDQSNWRKILGQQLAERLSPSADDDGSEWSIVLHSEQPCELQFIATQGLAMTVHLLNFKNPEFEHDHIDLVLKFESSVAEGKWVLQRKLPPEVQFLADPASGQADEQLSGRQLSLRSVLRRRVERLVGEELTFTPQDLGFAPRAGRSLAFADVVCGDEWLVLNLIEPK